MADKKKRSFVIYQDWMNMVLDLPDDQALDLVRTIFAHCVGREYQPGAVATAVFATFRDRIDDDIREYNDKCAKNAESVRKRWEKERIANERECNTNVYECNTNVCERNTDNDNEYDYENDNDNEPLQVKAAKREDANASRREVRHKYGQYQNVLLSDSDLEKLKAEFPYDWEERIERLSEYIESKGAKYKNHLATIRAWARKNGDAKSQKKDSRPYGFRVIDDMDWGNDDNSIDGQWEDVAGR